MSSIACRRSLPGAMRARASSSAASLRGSPSEGVRVKPSRARRRHRVWSLLLTGLHRAPPPPPAAASRPPQTRSLPCAGVPDGTIAARARASRTRRAGARPGTAGRRRPVRPSSPNAAVRVRTGTPRAAEAIASATARSAPGSSIRTPPATLTKTSAAPSAMPGVAREHRDDHREPLRVDPGRDTARHGEVGRRDERLDLEQDRPRPLERARDRGADLAALAAPEQLRRVGDADEARAGHLEDAELVRRAEAVLRRAQDAVGAVAVALELEHAVDEVLEHARARDGAVLRHVADEDRRDAATPSRRGAGAPPPRAPARPSPGAEPSSGT